jgi:hypothetical protein
MSISNNFKSKPFSLFRTHATSFEIDLILFLYNDRISLSAIRQTGKTAKSTIQRYVKSPFYYVSDRKVAKLFLNLIPNSPAILSRIDPVYNRSPAIDAFRTGRLDIASFFIEQGARFEIDCYPHLISDNLFFEWPVISRAICQNLLKDENDRRSHLIRIFNEACHKGNLDCVKWTVAQTSKQDMPLPIPGFLEVAIRGGFEAVVTTLCDHFYLKTMVDFGAVTLIEQQRLEKASIEMGYPHLLFVLNDYRLCANKHARFCDQFNTLSSLLAPLPIYPFSPVSALHHSLHGGSRNYTLFEQEYRHAVVYALHYILRQGNLCNFATLIDNLGHRRRRMACLGNLPALDQYGTPQPSHSSQVTPYGHSYAQYGERIKKKYGRTLPRTGILQIDGKPLPLSTIQKNGWAHPSGKHREVILGEIDRLSKQIIQNRFDTPVLTSRLLAIHWILAQSAPFMRGTPVIQSMFTDALWLHQLRVPPLKTQDLNCEALVYDNCDEFIADTLKTMELPDPSLPAWPDFEQKESAILA